MTRSSSPTKSEVPAQDGISYISYTRRLGIGLIMILPLIVLYQIGIVQANSSVRNLAEVWMTGPISAIGVEATTIINILIIGGIIYGLCELQQGVTSVFFLVIMLLESFLYAMLLFTGVNAATEAIESVVHRYLSIYGVPTRQLLLCLGAGVYEELLFRLLLVGGLVTILKKVFMWNTFLSAGLALVVSSLLFSAVHHIGSAGDALDMHVFLFRTLCGLVLGIIFLLRGIGIAVWSHALYNVMVLFFV